MGGILCKVRVPLKKLNLKWGWTSHGEAAACRFIEVATLLGKFCRESDIWVTSRRLGILHWHFRILGILLKEWGACELSVPCTPVLAKVRSLRGDPWEASRSLIFEMLEAPSLSERSQFCKFWCLLLWMKYGSDPTRLQYPLDFRGTVKLWNELEWWEKGGIDVHAWRP